LGLDRLWDCGEVEVPLPFDADLRENAPKPWKWRVRREGNLPRSMFCHRQFILLLNHHDATAVASSNQKKPLFFETDSRKFPDDLIQMNT
jgi:hypothetical protein